jgi:hypothetical protein
LNFWLLKSAGMACSCFWTTVQSTLGASPVLLPGLLPSARADSVALRASGLEDFMLIAERFCQLMSSCVTPASELSSLATIISCDGKQHGYVLLADNFAPRRARQQRCPLNHLSKL